MFMRSDFVQYLWFSSKIVISLKLIKSNETGQTQIQKLETRLTITYYTIILANSQKVYSTSMPDCPELTCFIHKLTTDHSVT
jgi:hypothetical protein